METLQQCKEEVAKREKERHRDEMKIFYPDPMEENNCAQCGKPKEKHRKDVSDRPFFCNEMVPKKSFSELSDEAAELYASLKSQQAEERIKELEADKQKEWEFFKKSTHDLADKIEALEKLLNPEQSAKWFLDELIAHYQ